MLIKKIIVLPHEVKYLAKEFVVKNKGKEITQNMKEKFVLVKESWGCYINSIDDQGVCFIAHILVGKIMRKCMVK